MDLYPAGVKIASAAVCLPWDYEFVKYWEK